MKAKTLPTSVDFEEVGDVLEGFEIADDQLARINSRVERLLADDDVLREVRKPDRYPPERGLPPSRV